MLQSFARSALFPRALQRLAERGYGYATTVNAGVNLSDRKTLKKFIGVTDCLGEEADARGTLTSLLEELRQAVSSLPADADYRRAVEAITDYRLKVLAANPSDAAVEEVLDCHLEEAILETREELRLVPLVGGELMSTYAVRAADGPASERNDRCHPIARSLDTDRSPSPPLPVAPSTHPTLPTPKNPTEYKPWDVPAGTEVPVFDYTEADEVLGKSTIAHKTGQTVVPPPPPMPPRTN
jgi:NADH dehydrogenase (ubiquinone) 1 alpha subcomplex subunit 5